MSPNLAKVAACAACLALPAANAQDSPFTFRTERVAPGVYAFVEPPGRGIVSGNSIAVVGDEAVLVVDTGAHPDVTRRMIAEIAAITDKPVRYVVNTHWHSDHVGGNAVYAQAFPAARFIAHRFTARALDEFVRPYFGEACERLGRSQTAPLREMAAKQATPDGKPIAADRLERIRGVLREADAMIRECGEIRFRGSDVAFEQRITVRLGGRDVEVMWLGRANTAGDAIVYVPDAKVLATGDVLVHPFPFATQSYISEWAAVLRKLEAMDVAVIVPGHGEVQRDKRYLAEIASLMEAIGAQVRAAYRPGATLEEVRAKVDLEPFRARIAGNDAFLNANFRAMVVESAVARAWQEEAGRLEPEGMPKS